MASSKELTARVKLDTSNIESKLKKLENRIKSIQNILNGTGSKSNLDAQITKAAIQSEKLNQAVAKTALQQQKVKTEVVKTAIQQERLIQLQSKTQNGAQKYNNILDRIKSKVTTIGSGFSNWTTNCNAALSKLKQTRPIFGSIWQHVRQIASALIGIGTIKLAVQGADTLVGAQNRLNNIAAKQIGDTAYTRDTAGNITGYSSAATNFSQEAMDKIYTAAKNSRSLYSDMMANVSKTMTLAPAAFDKNIDKAIRFQEIMTKSYAVGGASAKEMSSSMYQLTQALGAGVLQGDELRSVREGAPLAYQAIEEFAQGVLHTTDSLKDLASEGKITSDMVVAAVMNMGDEVDQAFSLTKWRFSEVWDSIKSAGQRAFQPVITMLTTALNKAVDTGLVEKFEKVLTNVAKVIMIVFKAAEKGLTWIKDNIKIITRVLWVALSVLAAYYFVLGVIAVINGVVWAAQHFALILTIALIAAVIYMLYLWADGSISTGQLIMGVLTAIAMGIMLIGLVTHSTAWFIVGVIVLALAIIAGQSSSVCDFIIRLATYLLIAIVGIMAIVMMAQLFLGISIMSTTSMVILFIVGAILLFVILFLQYTQQIMAFVYAAGAFIWNLVAGLVNGIIQLIWSMFVEPFLGIIEWILNVCNGGFDSFGGAVANLIGNIIGWFLSLGKVVTKIIDAIFGTNWTDGLKALQAKVTSWGKNEKSITLNREAPEIMSRKNVGDAWNKGWDKGTEIQNSINNSLNGFNFGSSGRDLLGGVKNQLGLDNLGKKLGIGFGLSDEEKVAALLGTDVNNAKMLGAADPDGFKDLVDQYDKQHGYGGFPNISTGSFEPDYQGLLENIDGNTGNIADSMELTEEDLEYLRRVADMEWKKEFTTATIQVDMSNYNTVNGDADLDNIVTKLSEKLYEELNVVANGVYA